MWLETLNADGETPPLLCAATARRRSLCFGKNIVLDGGSPQTWCTGRPSPSPPIERRHPKRLVVMTCHIPFNLPQHLHFRLDELLRRFDPTKTVAPPSRDYKDQTTASNGMRKGHSIGTIRKVEWSSIKLYIESGIPRKGRFALGGLQFPHAPGEQNGSMCPARVDHPVSELSVNGRRRRCRSIEPRRKLSDEILNVLSPSVCA